MASFVIDEDLSEALAKALRSRGHVAVTIRQAGLRGADDDAVFRFAQEQAAVLVTEDLYFSNIVAFPLGTHFGIVVFRIPADAHYSIREERLLELIEQGLLETIPGCLAIVEAARTRLRRP